MPKKVYLVKGKGDDSLENNKITHWAIRERPQDRVPSYSRETRGSNCRVNTGGALDLPLERYIIASQVDEAVVH